MKCSFTCCFLLTSLAVHAQLIQIIQKERDAETGDIFEKHEKGKTKLFLRTRISVRREKGNLKGEKSATKVEHVCILFLHMCRDTGEK